MEGKNSKFRDLLDRNPLNTRRRITGAVVGLAAFGVIAGTAQAAITSDSGGDTAGSVAAAQVAPQQQQYGDRPDGEATKKAHAKPKDKDRPKKADKPKKKADKPGKPAAAKPQTRRDEVIRKAKSWNPGTSDRVRYSQVRTHDGYRADCSGFVSMTLGLDAPGENTVGLTSSRYTKRIKMSELKKGDLVMDAQGTNTTRHVVIFEKWANKAHTSYWAYEQRGRYGTDHRTRSYGLDSGSEYKAYRPKNL